MLILSTILVRLWIVLAIPPNGVDLLIMISLFLGYYCIAFPLSWRWRLVDLEPIYVWWNLQLYRYQLRLYNNRQAVKLMLLLGVWVTIEELLLRVSLVPLLFERMPISQRLAWIAAAWAISISRYVVLYCRLHPFFAQVRLILLAILFDLACLITYVLTESLWLTIFFHWLVVVSWLLLLGGQYQLRQYQKLKIGDQKF